MNNKYLMLLLLQLFLASYALGQNPILLASYTLRQNLMCSKKIVFVDGAFNASTNAKGLLSFPAYNPATKIESASKFAIHNPDCYNGQYSYISPFAYNPMPFDIAKEGTLPFLTMYSQDGCDSHLM